MIQRGEIQFNFRRDGRRLVVTAKHSDGRVAYGSLANDGGAKPVVYPRLEFWFSGGRWIEPFCDKRYWLLDDYETHEDAEKRPLDWGQFNLTPDEVAMLQTWSDQQMADQPIAGSPVAAQPVVAERQTLDIDSGLGIGGINNDQAMPVVPSVAAIERAQRMQDTDTVCRRCGASKHFDGAMFSTLRDICDDCAA